jgi:hypothetical protein
MNPPTVYLWSKFELIHLSHVRKEQSLKAFKANRHLTDQDGPNGVYFEDDKTLMKGQVVPFIHDFIRLPLDSFVIEIDDWSPPPSSSIHQNEKVWIPLPCFPDTSIRLTRDVVKPTYASLADLQGQDALLGLNADLVDLGVSIKDGKVSRCLPDHVYYLYRRLQMPDGSFIWFRK